MSHKKEHTVMVNKVLQELARQQGQTVEAVLEQFSAGSASSIRGC
ncbi:TPA: hypothetical protein ACSW15_003203 [Enterobacter hormaechei]|nr:hypothetical protein [Enterobacter hormaechei]WBK47848.1 hypothetical protein OEE80_02765 [Enterobacter hormaechei]WDU85857.1 hypothetical protein PWH45_18030 [Enterobacter hormaechei]WDW12746.1 hypothetical protein PWP98_18025 [Enterobacter hormaechei]CZW48731.1 Uncharacterised protein [Enterobacter hormaechei]